MTTFATSMPKIERLDPPITPDQLIELTKAAASSKTDELEKAVAHAIRAMLCPLAIYSGPEEERP